MKIQHRISFNRIVNLERRLIELGLEHDTIAESPEGRLCFFYIYEDDTQWAVVKKLVEKYGVWDVEKIEFSKEEKEGADWFYLYLASAGYPQPEADFGFLNQTYDIKNYCRHCGIGKEQNNAFRFKKNPTTKNRELMGLNWIFDEVFVRPVVKATFEKEKVKGIDFSNPKIYKSNFFIDDLYQIKINHILQNGLVTDQLESVSCKKKQEEPDLKMNKGDKAIISEGFCHRTKYHFPRRSPITFHKEIFKGAPEIVKSSEWFGTGGSASRLVLISKRVKKIIDRERWRGASFEPVFLK